VIGAGLAQLIPKPAAEAPQLPARSEAAVPANA
jgi:hypothetical protein